MAAKEQKLGILTIVCMVTDMHRKAAIRKFHVLQMREPAHQERRGRKTHYTPDVTAALKDVWIAGNEVCGELLHPMVNEYIDILIRDKMWAHSDEATGKLRAMSKRTIKRRVGSFFKMGRTHHGISATKPSALKHLIPVFHGPWEDKPPGWGQIDTVVHCGSSILVWNSQTGI